MYKVSFYHVNGAFSHKLLLEWLEAIEMIVAWKKESGGDAEIEED